MKSKISTLLLILACMVATHAQTIKAPASYPKPEINWQHPYHQTLMMKLFLSSVDAEKGEGKQVKIRDKGESKVVVNFEQALEIIRKMDNLTLGIPKIVYLVGWQYNGHDSKYPAWGEINPKLKRPQDKTALESMKWLMAEAFKYNTTVSVHINMFDAYEDSPLWDTYVANNIIAKNTDGSLRRGEWGWPVSYTQEWNTGYAQKRIDAICEMLPLTKAGTVHIDAFHTWAPFTPDGSPISPYLGFTAEQESETQAKIYRYWASKGIDVTSEGMRFLRLSAFEGLQPAAWWFSPSVEEYMKWPASYYCGGSTNDAEGLLFGKSMHGEDLIGKDPQQLAGFLQQFCTQTLPWYYLNRLQRLEYNQTKSHREVRFSDGVVTRIEGKEYTIKQDGHTMLQNGDVFMPALWMDEPAIIAYSTDGYKQKTWQLPVEWNKYKSVDLYRVTLNGIESSQQNVAITGKSLQLALGKDEAILVVPAGVKLYLSPKNIISVADFGLNPNSRENAVPYIQKAIEACRKANNSVLVFPTGRYDFWPEGTERREYFVSNTSTEEECPSKVKNIGLLFENMKNLTLEGNGSQFVFHGKMITWALDHCENIRIQNIVTDFERPSMSEMKLVEVTPGYIIADIHPDSKYTIVNGKLHWYGEGWAMHHYHVILEDIVTGTGIYSSWDPIFKGTTTALSPSRVRIDGDFSNTNYKAGQVLTVRDPIRDHVGAFVNLSRNVRLENVTMHYMHGLGIISQFSENLTYHRVNVVPSGTRVISAFADGMHFSGCKGTITIDDCRFKGLHDDPVNVHGTYLRITEVHSPTRLTVKFMHGQSYGFPAFFENDTIAFIQAKALQTKGIALVKKVALISEREMQLELTAPLPEGLSVGDCLENLTWTPALTVRNTRFELTNTRGMLVTTPRKVVIENNVFFRTGMYGILIAADAGSWFESGAVKDILIRNNVFDGCAYNYPGNSYAISIEPENHELVPQYWVHRNIRIKNNTFRIYDTQIVRAKSVNGLIFENNTIESGTFPSPLKDGDGKKGAGPQFKLDACTNVVIKNNINKDTKNIQVDYSNMKKTDLRMDKTYK